MLQLRTLRSSLSAQGFVALVVIAAAMALCTQASARTYQLFYSATSEEHEQKKLSAHFPNHPADLALLPDGIVVADNNHRVTKLGADGRYSEIVNTGPNGIPVALTRLPDQSLVLLDRGHYALARLFTSAGSTKVEPTINLKSWLSEFNTGFWATSSTSAMTSLPDGSILIADKHRILRITDNFKQIRVAKDGFHSTPIALAVHDTHHVLVSFFEGSVFSWDLRDNSFRLVLGTQEHGCKLIENKPLETQLRQPSGITVLTDKSYLVADTGNSRILKVSPQHDFVTIAYDHIVDPTRMLAFNDGALVVASRIHNTVSLITRDDSLDHGLAQQEERAKAAIKAGSEAGYQEACRKIKLLADPVTARRAFVSVWARGSETPVGKLPTELVHTIALDYIRAHSAPYRAHALLRELASYKNQKENDACCVQ